MTGIQRSTIIVTLCAFCVLCAVPAAVHAGHQSADALHRRHGHFIHIINFLLDLDLTPDQKNDLQAIFSETQNTLKPLLADIHELRSAMDETFLEEEIDTAQAESQIEEMSLLKGEMTTVSLNALLQAAQVLTPEQRQTIVETRDDWKQCFMRIRNLMLKLFGSDSVD